MKFTTTTTVLLSVSIILLDFLGQPQQKASALRQGKQCSAERDREMDICASRMGFLGDATFVVPKNSTSMESFCSNLKSSISCIQSYSRDCLQGFTKQLLTSLLKRGRQQYSTICSNSQSKQQFMTKMACLTDDKIMQFHDCMKASVTRFEFISKHVIHDNKLPALCCSYQIFNRDLDSTVERLCGKPTASNRLSSTNEYLHKIVGGTAGEFFGLICNDHRSIEDCKRSSKTSTVLDKLEEQTEKVHKGLIEPHSKSLIPVLLNILDDKQ